MAVSTTKVRLVRETLGTQVGRFYKPGQEKEVIVEASVQPIPPSRLENNPEGNFVRDGYTIFIMGKHDFAPGDFIIDDSGTRFKITSIDADWRDLGNYAQCSAEKVKE